MLSVYMGADDRLPSVSMQYGLSNNISRSVLPTPPYIVWGLGYSLSPVYVKFPSLLQEKSKYIIYYS